MLDPDKKFTDDKQTSGVAFPDEKMFPSLKSSFEARFDETRI